MAQNLLFLALSLLIAAQQPNVPESLKLQAISVAQNAIMVSMEENKNITEPRMNEALPPATEEPLQEYRSSARKGEEGVFNPDAESIKDSYGVDFTKIKS